MVIQLKDLNKFREMLAVKGFTQRSFAKLISISGPYMNQIVNGDRNPGPKVAKKICDGLDVEFDDIFFIQYDNKSYQKTTA